MADSKQKEPTVVRPVECKYCKETARYAGWTNGGVEFVCVNLHVTTVWDDEDEK